MSHHMKILCQHCNRETFWAPQRISLNRPLPCPECGSRIEIRGPALFTALRMVDDLLSLNTRHIFSC